MPLRRFKFYTVETHQILRSRRCAKFHRPRFIGPSRAALKFPVAALHLLHKFPPPRPPRRPLAHRYLGYCAAPSISELLHKILRRRARRLKFPRALYRRVALNFTTPRPMHQILYRDERPSLPIDRVGLCCD